MTATRASLKLCVHGAFRGREGRRHLVATELDPEAPGAVRRAVGCLSIARGGDL